MTAQFRMTCGKGSGRRLVNAVFLVCGRRSQQILDPLEGVARGVIEPRCMEPFGGKSVFEGRLERRGSRFREPFEIKIDRFATQAVNHRTGTDGLAQVIMSANLILNCHADAATYFPRVSDFADHCWARTRGAKQRRIL